MAALSGPRAGGALGKGADKVLNGCLKRVTEWKGPCQSELGTGANSVVRTVAPLDDLRASAVGPTGRFRQANTIRIKVSSSAKRAPTVDCVLSLRKSPPGINSVDG